jgi:hypothetical protein
VVVGNLSQRNYSIVSVSQLGVIERANPILSENKSSEKVVKMGLII